MLDSESLHVEQHHGAPSLHSLGATTCHDEADKSLLEEVTLLRLLHIGAIYIPKWLEMREGGLHTLGERMVAGGANGTSDKELRTTAMRKDGSKFQGSINGQLKATLLITLFVANLPAVTT